MSHITVTKAELQEMPGHGYVVERAPLPNGNPKILEVWLGPEYRNSYGRLHETLHAAISHTLREMKRDLEQQDARARHAASPVNMHIDIARGRTPDWTGTRREVIRVAERLAKVQRFLQVGRNLKSLPDERLAREVKTYKAPLDIFLVGDLQIEGAILDTGTALYQSTPEGERMLLVGAAEPTIIPDRLSTLTYALLDAESGKKVDVISARDALNLRNREHDRLRIADAPNLGEEGVAP
jgi:hypothetical protein